MACQVEDDTYTEHIEGVAEIDIASRNSGLYFIAPQVTFKERRLAQLLEETLDSFERPDFSGKSDGKYVDLLGRLKRTLQVSRWARAAPRLQCCLYVRSRRE